jgi:DNA-binding CsgD family transcriptional regulator
MLDNINISDRELEALDLFMKGYTATEAGKMLFISHWTIKDHLKSICQKLDAKNTREAVYLIFVEPMKKKIEELETRTNEKSLPFIIDNCTNKRSSVLSKAGYDQPRY